MKKSKRRNTIMLLILLVCGITIGFALLSTTLYINGTGVVKGNKWDIHWENVDNENGVDAQTPVIDNDKTTVTYEINLVNPGDYYEFTVDAVNSGTLDGEISKINHKFYASDGETLIEELPSYISYSVTYADGSPIEKGQRLNAQQTKTYKVKVKYKNNVTPEELPTTNQTIISKFTVRYVQADVEDDTPNITIARQTPGEITPGDVVTVKSTDPDDYPDQDFYVVSSDTRKTLLLAKYNLWAGYNKGEYTYPGEEVGKWTCRYARLKIKPTEKDYNLQSAKAMGATTNTYADTGYDVTAALDFTDWDCNTDAQWFYWGEYSEEEVHGGHYVLKSYYDRGGTIYYEGSTCKKVSDNSVTDYAYVYDEHSKLYPYVENYVQILKNEYVLKNATGRLLSYEEADSLKDIQGDDNESIILNHHQSYWLGSAASTTTMWAATLRYSNTFYNYTYTPCDDDLGIRPVIEISTKLLK